MARKSPGECDHRLERFSRDAREHRDHGDRLVRIHVVNESDSLLDGENQAVRQGCVRERRAEERSPMLRSPQAWILESNHVQPRQNEQRVHRRANNHQHDAPLAHCALVLVEHHELLDRVATEQLILCLPLVERDTALVQRAHGVLQTLKQRRRPLGWGHRWLALGQHLC